MYLTIVQAAVTFVANLLLELFKRWLSDHKQATKKRNKRQNK